jgi:hypothetical protein
MRPPVFLIGNPRSGTTMFRLMLTAHPAIAIPPECGFAVWWWRKYETWSEALATDDRIHEFVSDLRQSRKIETWELDYAALTEEIRSRRPASYETLVSIVYERYARQQGRTIRRWGDKNNFHIRRISDLRIIFPDAVFLHLVRDGRDVACSYRELAKRELKSKYAPDLPSDVVGIATEWRDNLSLARDDLAAAPAASYRDVR